MAQNIIELNGMAIDAQTGAVLGRAPRPSNVSRAQVQPTPVRQAPAQGSSMDGMVQPQRIRFSSIPTNSNLTPHQPQATSTLMRQAVQPQPIVLDQAKLQASLQPQAAMVPKPAVQPVVTPKLSAMNVDQIRARRARFADRSRSVEHFRPAQQPTAAMPYQQPAVPVYQAAPQPVYQAQALQPVVQQPAVYQQATAPQPAEVNYQPSYQPEPSQPAVDLQSVPTTYTNVSQPSPSANRQIAAARRPYDQQHFNDQPEAPLPGYTQAEAADDDIFERALALADSHEQPAPSEPVAQKIKRKAGVGKKVFAIVGSLAIFVGLCSFVAYQNRTQIELQMASAKAGFAATTPLYMPDSYKVNRLSYTGSEVAAQLISQSKPAFTITQKKSNWDSQTLLENFVATSDEEYKGYQSNGRTVYVYGKGNATWVNGGIWYQIKNAADLTDEQLVKIAASM